MNKEAEHNKRAPGASGESRSCYRDTTLNTGDNSSAGPVPSSGTGYNWTRRR